ncbi:MAG: 4a-hydroxytetrahydrobiopterin dehydratase [Planctomycetota bacterium]
MADDSSMLRNKSCISCAEGGDPLPENRVRELLAAVDGWSTVDNGKAIARTFEFASFYETMSFVNALAHVVNREDHHPDLEVSYGKCTAKFWTHTVGGLSENDFICAAKIDVLV